MFDKLDQGRLGKMSDCHECERLRAERDDWHRVADSRSAEINRLMNELASMKVAAESAVEYVAEREREECEKTRTELAAVKALLREAYPWVAYWNSNNEALLMCQRIRDALGDEPADPRPGHKP